MMLRMAPVVRIIANSGLIFIVISDYETAGQRRCVSPVHQYYIQTAQMLTGLLFLQRGGYAPIDHQDMAVYKTGGVRGKKHCGSDKFLDLAPACGGGAPA